VEAQVRLLLRRVEDVTYSEQARWIFIQPPVASQRQ
jgi:hypothetical protein